MYFSKCPNFSTKSRDDLNYHIAKKHATPPLKNTHKCKNCFKEFSGFYALRQHKKNEHGIQKKSPEIDVNNLLEDDDADLKEELQACQHFLVDSELEKRRHCVLNFAMSTLGNSLINQNLALVFKGLECAAKVSLAFGFVLKNVEDGTCRYFYAHENNTLMERSKLVCTYVAFLCVRKSMHRILAKSGDDRHVNGWCREFLCRIFGKKMKKAEASPQTYLLNWHKWRLFLQQNIVKKVFKNQNFLHAAQDLPPPPRCACPPSTAPIFYLPRKCTDI